MRILGWLGRGLLLTLVTLCVGLWVMAMTLQFTLLNRAVVISWFDKSGAYEHVLDSVVNLQSLDTGSQLLDQASLEQAINSTLTPGYVKQVSETGINAIFDWLEGKTETVAFSIPVDEKRAELQQQLASVIAPELEGLPACSSSFKGISSEQLEGLPANGSAEQTAGKAAEQAVEGSDFLTEPITQQAIDQDLLKTMGWLPTLVQNLGVLSIALPLVALVAGAGYVFLSATKLAGARTLAGHLAFGNGIAAAFGIAMWYFGGIVQLDQTLGEGPQAALIRDVVQPIIYQVVPSVGFWLAVFAGSIALLSLAAWVLLLIIGRRRTKRALMEPERVRYEPPTNHPAQAVPTPGVAPANPKPPVRPVGRM